MGSTVDDLNLKVSAESQSAISSLDKLAETLGNIASRIKTISSTPLKVNFTVSGGAEKEVNRLEQYVNKASKTMASNLQSAFNIPSGSMSALREYINEFTKAIATTGKANVGNINEELLRVARSTQTADATMESFYKTLNSTSKIAISKADMMTDAWKDMNGALRRIFTSDLSSGAITLDSWIQGLNTDLKAFLNSCGDISSPANQFETLTTAVEKCQQELNRPLSADSVENIRAAMLAASEEAKKTAKEIGNVKKALEATGGAAETQNTGFNDIVNTLKKLGAIDSDGLTKVGAAISGISSGVQSLNGVHVDVNSLEQITNLTKTLKSIPTVNTENIKNIGDALNTLSTSINSVSSIGSVDKSITNLVNALRRLASVNMTNFSASGLAGITDMVTKLAAVPDISNNVNRLVSSLSRLANAGNSIGTVSATLPTLSNALSGLITKISAFGTIDASIASFTSAIAQLASSGAKATQAAANLRELGNALYDVMVQMSKAPAINSSVVQLTQAMSQLGKQHITVKSGFTSVNDSATESISIFGKLKSSIGSLMSKAMSLYYSLYMIKRVLSGIWSAIESSMDYVETYNYFSVALGKVAEENAQYYEQYGYEDAETYANSFSERLEELTTKMTGYTIGDNGELIDTGTIGLGLDPNDLMNFQANILSITNSVGMMGETSEIASEALSMLSSDLSSLKNIDVDTVMDNLTSGLVGQSRVMYQYGIDITNATLQEYAYAYGVEKSVSSMTQSEKMQLRLIAILDQSRVAWGDQANTINSVANQYRIFKQQVSNLARVFGNLFIPILQAVLPYINAIIKALQKLFTLIGTAIYGEDWAASLMDGISGSSSSAADYMDDIEDTTSDLADDYDDATAAAEEYENTVLGIDELHKLNSTNDSSSSSSSSDDDGSSGLIDLSGALADLLEEYQLAWENAFANMESKVDELVDKLVAAGKFIATNWEEGWSGAFVADWEQLEENLNRIAENVKAIWGSDEVQASMQAFLEQSIQTCAAVVASVASVATSFAVGVTGGIADAQEALENFNKTKISSIFDNLTALLKTVEDLAGAIAIIGTVFESEGFQKIVSFLYKIVDITILDGLDALTGFLSDLFNLAFKPITDHAEEISDALSLICDIVALIIEPLDNLITKSADNAKGYEDSWVHKFLTDIAETSSENFGYNINRIIENLETLKSFLGGDITLKDLLFGNWKTTKNPLIDTDSDAYGGGSINWLSESDISFNDTWISDLEEKIKGLTPIKTALGLDEDLPIRVSIKNSASDLWHEFKTNWGERTVEILVSFKESVQEKIKAIQNTVSTKWGEIQSNTSETWKNVRTTLDTNWETIKENAYTKFSSIKDNLSDTWEGVKATAKSKWDVIKSNLSSQWDTIKANASTRFGNIRDNLSSIWENVKNTASSKWNTISSNLSTSWETIKTTASTKFGNVRDNLSTTWDSIKNTASSKWSAISSALSSVWDTIKNGGINAFSEMATQIASGFDALKTTLKTKAAQIGEAVIAPIKSLVNGVVSGINWILSKLGSSTKLSEWAGISFSDYYATGSEGIPEDTIGVVNDQKGSVYKELIVPPNGKPFIPEGRNVTLPLAKGTKIMPAGQTAELLKSGLPHFATGIGNLFGSAWSKAKDFTENIWDYVSNPKKIVQIAIDKFTDVSDMVSPWLDVAKGAVSTMLDSITDFVSNKFGESTPTVEYDASKGVEQWRVLAKKALEMCNQYTATNLNLLLYQMQTESGGNPNAINLWDSNAKKGIPSKGLMQVIDPTFKAYAMSGYNTNIWDPLSNMLAAIRYTVSRYGSLARGWQGHGYAGGIGRIDLSNLIPRFSAGGIVEDGLFQANQNEIIGRFANGKTAVANNDQIASGIAEAVQPAVYNAMMAANAASKGKNIELVIELDGDEIGRTVVDYQKLQNKRYSVEPSFV